MPRWRSGSARCSASRVTSSLPVSLRDVEESDIGIFYEHQADPESAAMAAFTPRDEPAYRSHVKKILADPSLVMKTIVYEGAIAGNCVSWPHDGVREVGYWIGKEYWGRGIASEALVQFLELIDERPLVAYVAKHNAASVRVLEKAGFTPDGSNATHLIFRLD